MAPKRKLTKEQVRDKKKEYARRRRERIKNDPVLVAIEAEKERKKYEMKKLKKQVKLAKDMSIKELKAKRKEWKAKSKKIYDKMKQRKIMNIKLEENLSLSSDIEIELQMEDSHKSSRRKMVCKEESKVVRENKNLLEQNAKLIKQVNKWRQRHRRLQQSLITKKSSLKVVHNLFEQNLFIPNETDVIEQ